MPMSPTTFRVKSMGEAADDLMLRQLRSELEFYKGLSLDYGQQIEGIAEALDRGDAVAIVIGRRPAARGIGRKGKR